MSSGKRVVSQSINASAISAAAKPHQARPPNWPGMRHTHQANTAPVASSTSG
jgi:hypothetical protein